MHVEYDYENLPHKYHPAWKCLGDCCVISCILGILVGFLYQNKKNPIVLCELFREMSIKVHIYRVLIMLVTMGIPSYILEKVVKNNGNALFFYFCQRTLLAFYIGIAFVKILPIIYERFNLTNVK